MQIWVWVKSEQKKKLSKIYWSPRYLKWKFFWTKNFKNWKIVLHTLQNISHILGPKTEFGHFWKRGERGFCMSFSRKCSKDEIINWFHKTMQPPPSSSSLFQKPIHATLDLPRLLRPWLNNISKKILCVYMKLFLVRQFSLRRVSAMVPASGIKMQYTAEAV